MFKLNELYAVLEGYAPLALSYKMIEGAILTVKDKSFSRKTLSMVLVIGLLIHYIAIVVFSVRQNRDYNSNIEEYISSNGIIEYNPPKTFSLVKAYGIYLPNSRKSFIYSGLEFIYGYKPKFVPNKSILAALSSGKWYDADWCYVIRTPEDVEYEVEVTNFTHKNWMLKLWSKFSDSATSQFYLDSYEVMLNDQKYTIALKNNDDFIINKIKLIQKDIK
jgi:hypothetical protein